MKRVGSSGVQGLVVAVAIHALGLGGLFVISPPEPARASYRPPVKVRVATRPDPPPPKVTEAKPPAPEPDKPIVVEPKKPLKRRVASVKKTKAPKVEPVAPAATPTPAAPAKPGRSGRPTETQRPRRCWPDRSLPESRRKRPRRRSRPRG